MSEFCKYRDLGRHPAYGWHCSRKADTDGFCWQHHPSAVKEREKERAERAHLNYLRSPVGRLKRAHEKLAEKDAIISELVDSLEATVEVFAMTTPSAEKMPGVTNARALIAKYKKD